MTISSVLSAVKPNQNNIIEGSWDIRKGIWGPIGWEKKSYSECSMKICNDEDESLVSLRAGAQASLAAPDHPSATEKGRRFPGQEEGPGSRVWRQGERT